MRLAGILLIGTILSVAGCKKSPDTPLAQKLRAIRSAGQNVSTPKLQNQYNFTGPVTPAQNETLNKFLQSGNDDDLQAFLDAYCQGPKTITLHQTEDKDDQGNPQPKQTIALSYSDGQDPTVDNYFDAMDKVVQVRLPATRAMFRAAVETATDTQITAPEIKTKEVAYRLARAIGAYQKNILFEERLQDVAVAYILQQMDDCAPSDELKKQNFTWADHFTTIQGRIKTGLDPLVAKLTQEMGRLEGVDRVYTYSAFPRSALYYLGQARQDSARKAHHVGNMALSLLSQDTTPAPQAQCQELALSTRCVFKVYGR